MKKATRWSALALVLVLVLTACATEDDVAALEAARGPKTPATYLIVSQGRLPASLQLAANANRDTLRSFHPEAGVATIVTSDPNAYKRFGSVVRDVVVQWIDPTEQVALKVDYENPPFSGDDDFYFDLQWGHDAVNAVEAWNAGVRGAGVTVAVLDTGFDLDHRDLKPNINRAVSEDFTGEGLQYTLQDTFSHGTHVAGTIAAADNAYGVIGVAPEAELMLVKVLGDGGSGSFGWLIEGLIHAADNGADIINMSLGAYLTKSGQWGEDENGDPVWVPAKDVNELRNAIARAVRYATQNGVLVVASAGNEAVDMDKVGPSLHVPGDVPGVVNVSATAPRGWATDPENADLDYPASYSNYGRSVVDLAAPGGDVAYPGDEICQIAGVTQLCYALDLVFSTGNGGFYWSGGTSMAAPHVAGVAALILSEHGGSGSLKPAQLEAELLKRADDLGQPGRDPYYGMGRVTTGY